MQWHIRREQRPLAPRRSSRAMKPALEVMDDRVLLNGTPLGPTFPIATGTTAGSGLPFVAKDRVHGESVVAWTNGTDVFFQLYSSAGTNIGGTVNVTHNGTSGTTTGVAGVDMNDNGTFVLFMITAIPGGGGGKNIELFNSSGTAIGSPFFFTVSLGAKSFGVGLDNANDVFVLTSKPPVVGGTTIYLNKLIPSGSTFTNIGYTVEANGWYSSVSVDQVTGEAVVAWVDGPPFDGPPATNINFRLLSSAGVLGSKTVVFTATGDPNTTTVSMNNSGNFVVGYSYSDTSNVHTYIGERQYNSAGSPLSAATVVTSVASSTGYSVGRPSVAINDSGQFVEVWLYGPTGSTSANYSVQAAQYTPGSGFGSIFTIEGPDVSPLGGDAQWVAIDNSGQFFAVWPGTQPTTGAGKYGRIYHWT